MTSRGQIGTSVGVEDERRARLHVLIEWVLIAEGILLLLVSEKHRIIGDGLIRYRSLRLLLERGEWSSSPYSLIGPIFDAPLYLLDRLFATPMWWSERYNFFVFALGVIALYRALRPQIDPTVLRKFVLILVIGSMFARHQMEFYGEMFTAVLAGAGLWSLSRRPTAWGGVAVILAVANTPAALVGLAFAAIALTLQHARWRHLLLPVAALALIVGEAWLRRGSPFVSGYEGAAGLPTLLPYSGRPGFSYPFLLGLLSILFSFGKGLAFFAPGLALGTKDRLSSLGSAAWHGYRIWLLFLAGMVVVYAKWWSWYGGWFWGPRFFLFASLPASLALAVALTRRGTELLPNVVVLAILSLSMVVGVTGVVFDQFGLQACVRDDYALEALCWYVPEFSALFRPFVSSKPLTAEEWRWIAYGLATFAWLAFPVAREIVNAARHGAAAMRDRLAQGMEF